MKQNKKNNISEWRAGAVGLWWHLGLEDIWTVFRNRCGGWTNGWRKLYKLYGFGHNWLDIETNCWKKHEKWSSYMVLRKKHGKKKHFDMFFWCKKFDSYCLFLLFFFRAFRVHFGNLGILRGFAAFWGYCICFFSLLFVIWIDLKLFVFSPCKIFSISYFCLKVLRFHFMQYLCIVLFTFLRGISSGCCCCCFCCCCCCCWWCYFCYLLLVLLLMLIDTSHVLIVVANAAVVAVVEVATLCFSLL